MGSGPLLLKGVGNNELTWSVVNPNLKGPTPDPNAASVIDFWFAGSAGPVIEFCEASTRSRINGFLFPWATAAPGNAKVWPRIRNRAIVRSDISISRPVILEDGWIIDPAPVLSSGKPDSHHISRFLPGLPGVKISEPYSRKTGNIVPVTDSQSRNPQAQG